MPDTRGVRQDEIHRKNITTQIENHIKSVNAILILANGTVPRITVGTEYALSTLPTIFPDTVINNIAFMFTNVSSPLSWNFSQDTVPKELKGAPQFLLNNPVALQRRYLELKDDPSRAEMREAVKSSEQKALEMLGQLFDWLDGLKPQPMTKVQDPHEKPKDIKRAEPSHVAGSLRKEGGTSNKAEPPHVAGSIHSSGEISNNVVKSWPILSSDNVLNSCAIRSFGK